MAEGRFRGGVESSADGHRVVVELTTSKGIDHYESDPFPTAEEAMRYYTETVRPALMESFAKLELERGVTLGRNRGGYIEIG